VNNAEFRKQCVVQVETDGKAEGTSECVRNKGGNFCSADISGDLAVLLPADFKFVNNCKESSEYMNILNVSFRIEHIPHDIYPYICKKL
jgi:hypothetical protein